MTNGDCVSRDAVINHINLYPKIIGDRSALVLEIKRLPSVTPQIEPCEDCISRTEALDFIKGFEVLHSNDQLRSNLIQGIMKLPSATTIDSNEGCIRELIREFDNKHPALFADYMYEFNNHPISEIIEYMWDMHDLIEDIKYRLPDDRGDEE